MALAMMRFKRSDGSTDVLQVDEDAFLRMREEYLQMKRKEQEDHQKMRECALSSHYTSAPQAAHGQQS